MTHPVATTILQQLGSNKFIAMTGAKNFLGSATALTFRFPHPDRKAPNGMRIELDANDTYTMISYRIRGARCDVAAREEGVYAEDLQRLFTNMTGLDTHL